MEHQTQTDSVTRASANRLLLVITLVLTFGCLKPVEERLGRLANLLAGRQVDVLLAGLGSPCLEDLLRHDVVLVIGQEDRGDLRHQFRVVLANEAFGTAEEGLLVAFRGDHFLEQRSTGLHLLGDLLVENGLGEHGDGLVLVLDAEFLGFLVDFDVADLADAALLGGSAHNPAAKVVVGGRAIGAFVFVLQHEGTLQVIRKLLGASLDGLLGHIDGPVVILDFRLSLDVLGAGLDATGEFVIAASFDANIAILLGVIRGAISRAAISLSIRCGFIVLLVPAGLLGGLVLLSPFTGGVVTDDKGAQFQARINIRALTTGFAVEGDLLVLDDDIRLWVLALLAENELGDETIQVVLELGSIVGAIDDPTVVSGLGVCLSTQLEAEILDQIGGRAAQRLGDRVQVDDDCLDAIALALDLRLELLHLVTVEGIGNIATNVDGSHGDGGWIH